MNISIYLYIYISMGPYGVPGSLSMGPYGVPGSRDSWTRGLGSRGLWTRDLGSRDLWTRAREPRGGLGTRALEPRGGPGTQGGLRDPGPGTQGGALEPRGGRIRYRARNRSDEREVWRVARNPLRSATKRPLSALYVTCGGP